MSGQKKSFIKEHKKLTIAGIAVVGAGAYALYQHEEEKKQNESPKRLNILLISGENLLSKDFNGKSDPYVIFKQGHCKVKSKVIKKTLNPTWNEKLEIGISDLSKELEIEVFDKDIITRDDRMGKASFSLSNTTDLPQEVTLKLKGDAGIFSRNHGTLKVKFWISDINSPHREYLHHSNGIASCPPGYYPHPQQSYGHYHSPPQQGYPPQGYGSYPPQQSYGSYPPSPPVQGYPSHGY